MSERFVYLCVRALIEVISRIPRELAYRFCEWIATLVFRADARHRRIGMVNLRIAFPEADEQWRLEILRRSFQQLGRHLVEVSRLLRAEAAEIRGYVEYERGRGLENYLKAREGGRSVLFLTAHVSAWELLPSAHAAFGYPLSFVVRPLDNPYLDGWVTHIRSRIGNEVIPKRQAMKRTLRLLGRGRDVGFLIDQNVMPRDGVFAPFFGRSASTTPSLAALALKTHSPVVPGFIVPDRAHRGRYRIRFYPALEPIETGDYARDLEANTTAYNRFIEEVIREFPDCWLWGHRRFRTQPDGADPYTR